jgi:PAS domain S-box-containing protein
MSTLRAMGGDVEAALEAVDVPSYVIDSTGVIRWINKAAFEIVGDVRGQQFTSVCAPEERRRARELFAQKIAGTAQVTNADVVVFDRHGDRLLAEVSSVPLMQGGHVIGVFGQVTREEPKHSPAHPALTPRQVEVLRLLERGYSTRQIADELNLSLETVRNHVRGVLRALGVHSRLEAVALIRQTAFVAE